MKLFVIVRWPWAAELPEIFGEVYTEDRLDEAWRRVRDLEEEEFEVFEPSIYDLKELTAVARPDWVRYSWLQEPA